MIPSSFVKLKKLRAKQLMVGSGSQSSKIPAFVGGWIDCGNPIGSKRKYFKSLHFLKNSWVVVEGKRYYLGSDEYMVTGWKKIDGHYYYFETYIKNGKETAGYMVTYWHDIKGKRYYFGRNGKMVTTKVIDWKGKKYYVEKDGVMAVNKTIVDHNTGKLIRQTKRGYLLRGRVMIFFQKWNAFVESLLPRHGVYRIALLKSGI